MEMETSLKVNLYISFIAYQEELTFSDDFQDSDAPTTKDIIGCLFIKFFNPSALIGYMKKLVFMQEEETRCRGNLKNIQCIKNTLIKFLKLRRR